MEVMPDEEEVALDAIPLAVKSPSIVDWKIHKEGKKSYYQIIRADGSSKMYLVFSHMLKSFDREDLETLYKLVKAKYRSTRLVEDLDLVLYGDLKTMFEPHVEDNLMPLVYKLLLLVFRVNAAERINQLEKNKAISEECKSCINLHSEIDSLSSKLAKFENSSYFLQEMIENQRLKKDKKGLGFTEDKASTCKINTGKMGQESTKVPFVEPAHMVPSAMVPASENVGYRGTVSTKESLKLILQNRSEFVQVTKKTLPTATVRLKVKMELDEWIKDSGCSRHMTGNKDLFSTYEAINEGNVVFGSNTKSKIIDKGQTCDKKCKVLFSEIDSEILKYGITIGKGIRKNELYFSKKQTALAISTTEAEYVSTGKACQQALWMKQALVDYDIKLDDIPVLCDNKGAIDLSKNHILHSRTKHIEIRHHFLRDNVQKGNISIEKVSSEDNIADIFTKRLKRKPFNLLRLGLGLMEPNA
ncbi:hypothetical protein Tco_0154336 [Tanacetum coccineum]